MSGACSQPLQCPATAMRQLDPVTNPRHMCEGYSGRFVMCVCVCVCVHVYVQDRRNWSEWSGQDRTTFSALGWVMVIYVSYL